MNTEEGNKAIYELDRKKRKGNAKGEVKSILIILHLDKVEIKIEQKI